MKSKRKLLLTPTHRNSRCGCAGAYMSAVFVHVSSAGLALVIVALVRPRLPIAVLEEHLDAAPQ